MKLNKFRRDTSTVNQMFVGLACCVHRELRRDVEKLFFFDFLEAFKFVLLANGNWSQAETNPGRLQPRKSPEKRLQEKDASAPGGGREATG